MSKLLSLFIGALLCTTVLASELWSGATAFDGSEITSTPITLLTTDQIFYSSALADGEPVSLELTATDTSDSTKVAELFYDNSQTAVEGTATWNYEAQAYDDFSKSDVYELKETIVTSEGTQNLTRNVRILPEPACLVLLAILGGLFLARRKGALMLLVLTVASIGVFADVTVTSVTAQQAWPFKRSVVINYTLESDTQSALPVFNVSFYGTFDNGETIFDLKDRGTLEKEGASCVLFSAGTHKVIWNPASDLNIKSSNLKIKVEAEEVTSEATYLVVDLSGGTSASSFAVSYLSEVPEGGWSDEYRTTKLVLRLVQPGTFTMGSPSDEIGRETSAYGELQHDVTLTKPYYIGIFETTQRQYELITGSDPADLNIGQKYPVEQVSYDMIRGNDQGANWPADNNVDSTSFMGVLRAKTGLTFDLPTEAQWEYACRATTTTALNSGKDLTNASVCPNMAEVGRYTHNTNDGKGNNFVEPGQYLVNNWGIFDMHGNLAELCLDYYADYSGSAAVTDPKGPSTGTLRVKRGGSWQDIASECRSARRVGVDSNFHNQGTGFRVVVEQ
ncbi:formylglycine-generating enzyme family protein [bacterium]|nr:formylglycine-generating enzyme family protein [bacterium]